MGQEGLQRASRWLQISIVALPSRQIAISKDIKKKRRLSNVLGFGTASTSAKIVQFSLTELLEKASVAFKTLNFQQDNLQATKVGPRRPDMTQDEYS